MPPPSICLFEPQMDGLFHALFNAAFLHCFLLAFPDRRIIFSAHHAHLEIIRKILFQIDSKLPDRIEWRALSFSNDWPAWRRLLSNRKLLRQALDEADWVVFTSISRLQLFQLKSFMGERQHVWAVLHGDIERILYEGKQTLAARLFGLKRALLSRHPSGLRYLLLGQSLKDNLPASFDKLQAVTGAINLPYHFVELPSDPGPQPIFGSFGNHGPGLDLLELARAVKACEPKARLNLIGYLEDEAAVERLQPYVADLGNMPISRELMQARARAITHAVWLARPGAYRLRASGAFLDALTYCKPLVFTANAYIDPHFQDFPEIGIRCQSIEEATEAVLAICRNFDRARYRAAQRAMLALRERFTPECVATTLARAMGIS